MHRRFTILFLSLVAGPSLAQTDLTAMARQSAANQLGLLQYCQAQGAVGDDAVKAERDMIAGMPAAATTSPAASDQAEALGKQGTMSMPNGQTTTLAGMASTHNMTVSALCQQLGSGAVQSAAALRQNGMTAGASAGMPAMPGSLTGIPGLPPGMTVPGMPSGAGMTAIPGLPAMPGLSRGN